MARQKGCASQARTVGGHWQTEPSGSQWVWESSLGSHGSTSSPTNVPALGQWALQGAMKTGEGG